VPQSCTVCSHPDAIEINEALIVQGLANRAITRQYALSKDAVRRHKEHIPELLAKASRAEEVAQADTLLDRLEDLQRRTAAILERVEDTDNFNASLGAIREMRRNLEVIGEVTKELDRTPTVNLHLNPEFIQIRNAIVAAVAPYPDAAQAISQAMTELEEGDGHGES
jgi:hypothetical protein